MIQVIIQFAVSNDRLPSQQAIEEWAEAAFQEIADTGEICIRIVDQAEIQSLNKTFRHKDQPTNILSFPYTDLPAEENAVIGDIAICAEIVEQEALEQHTPLDAHWAHLVIHGCLHLQGYVHDTDQAAERMEQQEIKILERLGFENPYLSESE